MKKIFDIFNFFKPKMKDIFCLLFKQTIKIDDEYNYLLIEVIILIIKILSCCYLETQFLFSSSKELLPVILSGTS